MNSEKKSFHISRILGFIGFQCDTLHRTLSVDIASVAIPGFQDSINGTTGSDDVAPFIGMLPAINRLEGTLAFINSDVLL